MSTAGATKMKVIIPLLSMVALLVPQPAHAQARAAKQLAFGYATGARPFSYADDAGKPTGYGVELCQNLVQQIRKDLGLTGDVEVTWVSVATASWIDALRDGKVRLVCGAPVTLAARKDVSFSIPIFQGGVGALTRIDAPAPLTNALLERPTLTGPLWRDTATQQLLQEQTLAVVAGSPAEKVVASSLARLKLAAKVTPVKDVAAGVQAVVDHKAAVFFAEQSLLLDAAKRDAAARDLSVVQRRYTVAPAAIALKRGDEDARYAVDRALSRYYATRDFRALYLKWFGKVDDEVAAFFRLSALPE